MRQSPKKCAGWLISQIILPHGADRQVEWGDRWDGRKSQMVITRVYQFIPGAKNLFFMTLVFNVAHTGASHMGEAVHIMQQTERKKYQVGQKSCFLYCPKIEHGTAHWKITYTSWFFLKSATSLAKRSKRTAETCPVSRKAPRTKQKDNEVGDLCCSSLTSTWNCHRQPATSSQTLDRCMNWRYGDTQEQPLLVEKEQWLTTYESLCSTYGMTRNSKTRTVCARHKKTDN